MLVKHNTVNEVQWEGKYAEEDIRFVFIILFIRVFFTSVNKRMTRSLYKHIPCVSFHYVYNNNLHYSEEEDEKTTTTTTQLLFEMETVMTIFYFQAHFSRCTVHTHNMDASKKKQSGNNDSVWERHWWETLLIKHNKICIHHLFSTRKSFMKIYVHCVFLWHDPNSMPFTCWI